MKKLWFNFRPLCLIFTFLIIGSVFSFYFSKHRIISTIIILIVFALLLVISIVNKKLSYFVIPVVSFIFAVSFYNVSVSNFYKSMVNESPSIIEARVYNLKAPEDGRITLHADSVKFDGVIQDTRLVIYVYDYNNQFENFEIGSVIAFEPFNVYKTNLEQYDLPNSNKFNNNIKYSVLTNAKDIAFIRTDKTFAEKIKSKVKESIGGNLTNENIEIAYSALFGEKNFLNEDIYSSFQLSGVAHLLAVSGLHVGIIVGILFGVLGFFKVKKWPRVVIISIFLLLYAYICNFSVSVIRASIMALMLMIAPLLKREYDSLSAISFAGIIIFFINPLSIFDVSFVMSFACVLGILFFSKPISRALIKAHIPKGVANAIALSVSTMISLVFIMAYFFGRFNLISLFSNLIIIPIFTILFSAIFVLAFLSIVFSFVSYAFVPINYVLNFINNIIVVLVNVPFANISAVANNYLLVLLYFVLLAILGRMCVADNKRKVISTLPIVATMIAILI